MRCSRLLNLFLTGTLRRPWYGRQVVTGWAPVPIDG
jgi:hypothetical protein